MKLSWMPYNLELKYPFTISNYSRTTTPVVLTQIQYGDIVGYGEASLPQYLGETQKSVHNFLSKLDFTSFKDPTQIDPILRYVDSIAPDNTAAKASVDIALHDLVGKLLKRSWYDIWNLDPNKTPYSSYTIGIDRDEILLKKIKEVKDDFKILKIKLGSSNDKHLIQIVRSITDLPLAIDANQGWTDRYEALDMIYWLQEQDVMLVEQPMSKFDLDNTAWLTSNSPLPIFADESVQRLTDLNRLKGVFSGINIKLMKCTGLHEARKMIDCAPKLGFDIMLGCMTETSCAISAAAQLSSLVNFADLDGAMLIKNDCFDGMVIKNGKIVLNNLPGIGVIRK